MQIKVFGELDIQNFITNEKHIVISIQDPNFDFVRLPESKTRLDCMRMYFYDLDRDVAEFPYSRFIFNTKQARQIIDYVMFYKDKVDLICVNCVAGISRSAAVAGALSKILNNDDSYFFKHYIPNRLVYSTILKEFYG